MCVKEQNMLGTEDNIRKFLAILPKGEIRVEVKSIINQYSNSIDRWNAFVNFFNDRIGAVGIFYEIFQVIAIHLI